MTQEDPTCSRAAKSVHHNSRAWEPQLLSPHALEPKLHNKRSSDSPQLEKSRRLSEDTAVKKILVKNLEWYRWKHNKINTIYIKNVTDMFHSIMRA